MIKIRVEDKDDVVTDGKRIEERNLEDLNEKEDVVLKEIIEVVDILENYNTARIQSLKKMINKGLCMLQKNKDFKKYVDKVFGKQFSTK